MIFSVLEKIERGDRNLSDRELTLLLPYASAPEMRETLGTSALLRLQKLVKHDKEWEAEVGEIMAYDLLFGKVSSGVLDGMLGDLLARPGGSALELAGHVQRAAQEQDKERLRRLTTILMRLPDAEDGSTALSQVIMFDDYLALRMAAAGPRENMRHLLNCVLKPGRDRAPVDEAAWMREEHRMHTLVSLAAGVEPHRQDTADMLLSYARRAGVEKEILTPTIGLLLYYAARSGDMVRLQRVWSHGMKTLGPDLMTAALSNQRNDIITALALDPDSKGLRLLLSAAERDLSKVALTAVLKKTSSAGYGSAGSIGVLLECARRTGGQGLVNDILRAGHYQIFRLAGTREDTMALTVLETNTSEGFMKEMLGGAFLTTFIGTGSAEAIRYMVERAHVLCGRAPLEAMLLSLGNDPVANRSDYMSVIGAIQKIPCIRYSGASVAVTLPVLRAVQARHDGKMPTHEFWQRVGGNAERWYAVTNRPAPKGVNPYSSPWQFKPKMYEELLPHIRRLSKMEDLPEKGAEQIAYRYTIMFPNVQEAERYIEHAVRRSRPDAKRPPFTEASDFVIPGRGMWNVAHWRNLMVKHGRSVARLLVTTPQVEEYCTEMNLPLPRSAEELLDVAKYVVYPQAENYPDFARLALEHGLSRELYLRGVDVLKNAKTEDALPIVTIDGKDIGKPNYYMQKLAANDPRGLVLGHITNNCQTLGNNGEYAAIDGMTKMDSGFYVWRQKTKGEITPSDRIVAQSWAWLAPSHDGLRLVFDSYERLSAVYNHLARPFLEQYAHDTTTKGPLSAIFLGAGGGTPSDLGLKEAAAPVATPAAGPARPDSARQYAIAPVNHRKLG